MTQCVIGRLRSETSLEWLDFKMPLPTGRALTLKDVNVLVREGQLVLRVSLGSSTSASECSWVSTRFENLPCGAGLAWQLVDHKIVTFVQPTQSAAKRARSSEDKDDEGVKPSAKRRRIIESAALVPIHRICGVGADGNVRVILQGGGSSTRIWKRFYDTKTGVIDPCMLAYLQDPNNAIHRSHFLAMISTHVGPDAIKGVHEALSKTAHVELAEVVD